MSSRWIALTLMLAWTATSPAAMVRLKERCEVATTLITLGDIAEVLSNDEAEQALLRGMEISPSPEKGASLWLDLAEVKDRLYRRGVRLDAIEFTGSRRVEVLHISGAVACATENRTTDLWRQEIERLVATSAVNDFPGIDQEDLRVRVEAERATAFLAEHPTENWELLAPPIWHEGWQAVELVLPNEQETLRFPAQVQIWWVRPIVTVGREVKRGETISTGDIQLARHESPVRREEFLDDPSAVVGMEAKRDLSVGRPITSADIRPTPVVFRGQPITVHTRFRTAWIEKTFLASTDAGVGEWIEVFDPERRDNRPHDYLVRVSGPHAGELPENAPLSATASRIRRTGPPVNERSGR